MEPDLPPPTLVQDARGFARLLERLERVDEVAVDTEADSFFSYREKVCLIQITAAEEDFLVDPLAGVDISGFGHVLADPTKLKVFHDGEYDVLILKRDFQFRFQNLFDTRVAAATLGSQAPGLASVLRDRFGIELDKSMQRSNWSQRPLSDKQVKYARLDTHFLLPLWREQALELEARGRAMIVAGECLRLEQLVPPSNGFHEDDFARVKGARLLSPVERPILRELYVLRDKLAHASDQSAFRIMNDETMIDLAQRQPRHRAELAEIRGFSSKQVRRIGDDVLDAIARGLEEGPMRRLPLVQSRDGTGGLSEEEVELHERLKQWRKAAAMDLGIDSAYLLNRHVLLRLSKERPVSADGVARTEGIQTWQVERHAEDIADVIRRFDADARSGNWQPRRRRPSRNGDSATHDDPAPA